MTKKGAAAPTVSVPDLRANELGLGVETIIVPILSDTVPEKDLPTKDKSDRAA